MKEIRKALGRIGIYYLLLAVNIMPQVNVIPDVFPIRNLSTIYLLILAVCLVLYNYHRVTPTGGISVMVKVISLMELLLILLRGIKYSAVSEVGILARHAWYLYYVPILSIPLLLFGIALLVSAKDSARIPKKWFFALGLTVVLILLVLTNDLHQQVFSFQPEFEGWDGDYTHGWLFYVVNAWQFALSLASIIILVVKCRVGTAKKSAWIILIPFSIGVIMYVLLLTGTMPKLNGTNIIEFPEAHIITAATVLECCMSLGFIRTNSDYSKMFNHLSISAQITDQRGSPVYASASAAPLTPDQAAAESGAHIDTHTVLHKMKIPGGYGFWQVDMTELDRLNEALAEAKEGLAEEAELIRLRNELKEKQTVIHQRTMVYDSIARSTRRQAAAISGYAEAAKRSADPVEKDRIRRQIVLLGAYIKRYANLMLLSEEEEEIAAGELGLSFSEILRYLNYCGIPSEFMGSTDCKIHSDQALALFEAFESIIESNVSSLAGVFVNLSGDGYAVIKITFEHLTVSLPEEALTGLSTQGIDTDIQNEDDITYMCFSMKGGAV